MTSFFSHRNLHRTWFRPVWISYCCHNFKLNYLPSINEVFDLFVEFPEFWELNSMHTQRMPDNDILKKINNDFNSMIPEGKLFAQSINHCLQPGKKIRDIEI